MVSHCPDSVTTLLTLPRIVSCRSVSLHIMQHCLLEFMKGKTRILVTHNLEVAQHADVIVVMDEGRVVQQGSYRELLESEGNFRTLAQEYGNETARFIGNARGTENVNDNGYLETDQAAMKIHLDEERSEGSVSWQVFGAYGHAMFKGGPFPTALTCLVLDECLQVANAVFLGFWSTSAIAHFRQGHYMGIYAALAGSVSLTTFLGSYTLSLAGLGASFLLFNRALQSVLRSPVSFFDRTPSGRIVSRLTTDVQSMDDDLPSQWYSLLEDLLSILGTIGLVFYSYPYLGAMFVPLFLIYNVFGSFYRRTSRQLKRITSITRSFVFSDFEEQLSGLEVIRAYRVGQQFLDKLGCAIDRECRLHYVSIVLGCWLSLRLELLGNALIFGIGIFGVCFRNKVSPAKLGVVLTYALSTTQILSQIVVNYAQVEREMNACERVSSRLNANIDK